MNLEMEFSHLKRFKWKKAPASPQRPWRTIAEITASEFFYGCSEAARLFIERVREQGVSVRFLAMMDPKKSSTNNIFGHCYVEVLMNGRWIKVDPTQRRVIKNYPKGWVFVTDREEWSSFQAFMDCHKVLL